MTVLSSEKHEHTLEQWKSGGDRVERAKTVRNVTVLITIIIIIIVSNSGVR